MVHYLDTTQTHILPSLPNMLLCLQASRHPSELFYLREQGFGDFIFGVFKLFRVHPQHLSPTEPRCSVGVELSPSDSYFISLFLAYSLRLTTPTQFFKHTHTHTGIRSALASTPRNIDHDALVRRAFSCSTQRIERELLLGQTGSELHVTSSQEAQWPETQCKKSLYTRTPTHRGALGGLD